MDTDRQRKGRRVRLCLLLRLSEWSEEGEEGDGGDDDGRVHSDRDSPINDSLGRCRKRGPRQTPRTPAPL